MAVALVIFARWDPVRCLWASLLFGGVAGSDPGRPPSIEVGVRGYNLYATAPYVVHARRCRDRHENWRAAPSSVNQPSLRWPDDGEVDDRDAERWSRCAEQRRCSWPRSWSKRFQELSRAGGSVSLRVEPGAVAAYFLARTAQARRT